MTPPTAPLLRARAGRRALGARVGALFDQYGSMVLGLCRMLLRDHHEAEDAAQQTFVSAYRSLLRGVEPRDPGPWLAAIARNECRARLRGRLRAPVALESEAENQLADPTDVVEVAERRAEVAALTRALAELPSRQREAVALREFLGLSYEEVASTLSVSVPVVESLLFRARRRLRDSVRTVPRYAAGLVVVPFAVRAALARDIPEFDSVGAGLGLAGAAGAAAAGVLAKLVSLPFASKTATAVAVVVAGTVGPQVGGLFEHDSRPPERAAALGAPAPEESDAGPVGRLGGAQAGGGDGPGQLAEQVGEGTVAATGGGGGETAAPEADDGAADPIRTGAAATGGSDPAPAADDGQAGQACADSASGAGGEVGGETGAGGPASSCSAESGSGGETGDAEPAPATIVGDLLPQPQVNGSGDGSGEGLELPDWVEGLLEEPGDLDGLEQPQAENASGG